MIEKICISKEAISYPYTKKIIEYNPNIKIEYIDDLKEFFNELSDKDDPIKEGKKILLLLPFYGKKLKRCPGTKKYLCCGYHVLNIMTNCPFDCSYCILQTYLNNPWNLFFVNIEDFLLETKNELRKRKSVVRIGTGELADSLALEPITNISSLLIDFFKTIPNGILELKTKSTNIEPLLKLDHRGKTVISFSLNPDEITKDEEKGAPSFEKRIKAAKRAQDAGYFIGFHLDPIIYYPNWEKGYFNLINYLSKYIDPKNVIWISMGGLRFPPLLKEIIRERFPNNKIITGELFPGKDGKFRYLKHIRIFMFKKIFKWIKEWNNDIFIYLCMESQEVWHEAFGFSPQNMEELDLRFHHRIVRLWRKF